MEAREHERKRSETGRVTGSVLAMGVGALAGFFVPWLGAVIFYAGYAGVTWISLPWALALYIVAAPFPIGLVFHQHHIFISDGMALIMAFYLFLKTLRERPRKIFSVFLARPYRGPLILLLALSVLSLGVAMSHGTTIIKILEYIEFFVVLVAVMNEAGRTEKEWSLLMGALFAVVAGLAIYGLVQFLFQLGPAANIIDVHHVRAAGFFGQPNAFGAFNDQTFPFLLALTVFGPKWARSRWLVAILLLAALAVVESFSRGSWVADASSVFFMGVLALAVKGKKGLSWRYVVNGIAIPVFLFVVIYILGNIDFTHLATSTTSHQTTAARIRSSITGVLHPKNHYNMNQRLLIWKSAVQAIRQHPLLGVGLGNFQHFIAKYPPKGLAAVPPMAHNLYLEWGADLGVGGIVASLWLEWAWLRSTIGTLRRHANRLSAFEFSMTLGAFGCFVAFIVHNWVDFMVAHGTVVPLLLAMAWMWSLTRRLARVRKGAHEGRADS